MTTFTFQPFVSANWNVADNWDPASGFPVAGDDAIVVSGHGGSSSAINFQLARAEACRDFTVSGFIRTLRGNRNYLTASRDVVLDPGFTLSDVPGEEFYAHIGGGFTNNGVNMGGVKIDVVGAAVAHDCVIANSDFSGGTELDATDGCTDGGGNTNVNFGSSPLVAARSFFMPR